MLKVMETTRKSGGGKLASFLLAVGVMFCVGAASAALTSRSYVQVGLIANYDGIDNAGYGVHSDNTNRWVNLVGDSSLDGVVSNAVTWVTNGWRNTSASVSPVTIGTGLAAQMATAGRFTAQMTVTPSNYNLMALFGQKGPNNNRVFTVERKAEGGTSSTDHNQIGLYTGDPYWKRVKSNIRVLINWSALTFDMVAGSFPFDYTVYDASNPNSITSSTIAITNGSSTSKLTFVSDATSVIGSDFLHNPKSAFLGTYHAFRLYSRQLTEDELKLNAAIDAVRFNGGNPEDYEILANYSFDDQGYLCCDFTATAEAGGKVRAGAGAAGATATAQVSAATGATFTAVPDAGYLFQEWTGDTSAIVSGSILTPTISVRSAAAGAVRAVFRKPGNALDGMVFDLDMQDLNGDGTIDASDMIGNAMKVSASNAASAYTKSWSQNTTYGEYSPRFETMEVAAPMTPFTTNEQTCLYFPQQIVAENKVFNSRVELANDGIMGEVATFFVRFKWEGAVTTAKNCNIALLLNGCSGGYWNNKKGFVLTIRTYASTPNTGYLNVTVPQQRTGAWDSSVSITSGSWVDCFVSVYPSPTNTERSNADVWICPTPTFSGGVFARSEMKGRHFDDSSSLPRMLASASTYAGIWFGSERNDAIAGADYMVSSFRGAIAEVKGWRRMLSTNEMWTVMSGQYGGTFNVGASNGSADEFGASGTEATFDPSTMAWQKMKKSLTASDRTLTISMPITAVNDKLAKLLTVKPLFDGVGASCPVTVTANGANVGTFDLMKERERTVILRGGAACRNANGRLVIVIERPAGCAGTLSFDAISLAGSWQFGVANNSNSEMRDDTKGGVPKVAVLGDPDDKHVVGALTGGYSSLSQLFDVPENVDPRCSWTYSTKFFSPRSGYLQPLHLELNGETVWSSDNVAGGTEVNVDLGAALIHPGLNELKWCYDNASLNWMKMDYHSLRLVPPPAGMMISFK